MEITIIASLNCNKTVLGTWEALQQGSQYLFCEPDINMVILGQAVQLASGISKAVPEAPGPGPLYFGAWLVSFTPLLKVHALSAPHRWSQNQQSPPLQQWRWPMVPSRPAWTKHQRGGAL